MTAALADSRTVSEAGRGDLRSPLRALTVQQPWAWAIAAGKKPVENRTWPTSHRGEIAIHAGKTLDRAALADRDRRSPLVQAIAWHTRLWVPPEYVLGAVIAVAEVTGCHHSAKCDLGRPTPGKGVADRMCSPWAVYGQFHIELARPRPLAEPVPCRGMLGLWRLPEEVEKAVREQLEASRA